MRPQPLICVNDVEASSRWYCQLLNCQSDHGGPNYERLVASGELVLQLHRWEVEHHHGRIGDPDGRPPGNGVLLWFEVDDIDAAIARAPKRWGSRSSYPAIGTRPMVMAAPITGRSGCVIRMVTRSCWRVRTARPTAIGGPDGRAPRDQT